MKREDYLHPDGLGKAGQWQKEIDESPHPSITKEHVENIISNTQVQFSAMPEHRPNMTVMYYELPNGFNGIVYSACVDPKNFNMEYGAENCFKKLENRIWELEGYALKNELYKEKKEGK